MKIFLGRSLKARYRRIVFYFARVCASLTWWELALPRLGLRGWAQRTRSDRLRKIAASYRALAVEMGGVMIKVGQFLSARVDVLPQEVITELAGLQDEVPPERFVDIREVAEAEFGAPLEDKFDSFDEQPLAAASLGQVHRAVLHAKQSSTEDDLSNPFPQFAVVVKVQRPDIDRIIATDLSALRTVAGWLRYYRPISRRVDLPALVAEFTRILNQEIDYLAEGANAETLATQFRSNLGVRIPHVVWSHTTKRVLTLEDVYAIKIDDYAAIEGAGIDRLEVASRLLDIYLKQIIEDGFFHADPHPGNLFVEASNGAEKWRLVLVDFGMVGIIPPNIRRGLREMIVAVGMQDAPGLVRSYQTLGILLPSADVDLLEKAEAKVFERFWGKSMDELRNISTGDVLEIASEFRELIYTMPFQLPHDLILLGRTVGILSGMCTGLDPKFNVWNHLAPYAKKLISEETQQGLEYWVNELLQLARRLFSLPHRVEAVLEELEHGDLAVRDTRLHEQVRRVGREIQRLTAGLICAALLFSGVQLYLQGETVMGWVFWVGAGLAFVWMVFPRRS